MNKSSAYSNLKELLLVAKKRPGMFYDPVNVFVLFNMLSGYSYAVQAHNIEDHLSDKDMSFHDWVAMIEGFSESTSGWAKMIDTNSKTDAEGVDKFYRYYESYQNREERILKKLSISQRDIKKPWKSLCGFSLEPIASILCPSKIEVVSFYEGPAVFIKYLDINSNLIESYEYKSTLNLALDQLECDFGQQPKNV